MRNLNTLQLKKDCLMLSSDENVCYGYSIEVPPAYVLMRNTLHQIRGGIQITIFLSLHEKIHCGFSLEAPRNEYPQYMFSLRSKNRYQYFLVEK